MHIQIWTFLKNTIARKYSFSYVGIKKDIIKKICAKICTN